MAVPDHVVLQLTAQTAAATSDQGPAGGWIPSWCEGAFITSSASSKIMILSDKIPQGKSFWITGGANGFKLGTPAGSSLTINNVDTSGATASAAIPANTSQLVYRNLSTGFIITSYTVLGAVGTAIVPS